MDKKRWLYAVIGVVVMLFVGMVYAWSVFAVPIAREFQEWNKTELSMTFTLVMIMFCVGCTVSGLIASMVPARIRIWSAATMLLVGLFLTARVYSLIMLYISFGMICGCGSGIAYGTVMGTIGKWFPDKQGLIAGVLLMGFGLSGFIIGKLFQIFTPDVIGAWRGTFTALGVIASISLLVCGLFVKEPDIRFNAPMIANGRKHYVNLGAMEASTIRMVKEPPFWLYFIWSILLSAAGLALVSQASGIAAEANQEVSTSVIATSVGLISIFNGIGRVIMGSLFDKVGRKVIMQIVNMLFIFAGMLLIVGLKTNNFTIIVIGFVVSGLAYGGVTPTNSAFISSYYGMRHYAKNFSLINTSLIVASFGSTLSGILFDVSQSYIGTCVMMCCLAGLGLLISLCIDICDEHMANMGVYLDIMSQDETTIINF